MKCEWCSDPFASAAREEKEGRVGRRGRKKEWRERRDSRRWWGGEEGVTKLRRRGRLLMFEAEERRSLPRVFISATPYRPFLFLFFFVLFGAMVAHDGSSRLSRQLKVC
ncbi:hypothetical protein AAHE18_17G088200 [Arachis hypogaea]